MIHFHQRGAVICFDFTYWQVQESHPRLRFTIVSLGVVFGCIRVNQFTVVLPTQTYIAVYLFYLLEMHVKTNEHERVSILR